MTTTTCPRWLAERTDSEAVAAHIILTALDHPHVWECVRDHGINFGRMLDDYSWSSGERVLLTVARALWTSAETEIDLAYVVCALDDRYLSAVLQAMQVRRGRPLPAVTA